ncbi:DUF7827 domain-containing protein [Halomicrococcus gelatinilyticus]|uniref:DUF7827 domain-containing protein n=1 Tax=Halomicrococcus gelatinilyticus TaxID=1702103 RepID=UPI002E160F7B
MTGNSDKLRSLFLTALMVVSVFAGSMAFAGSAAAASDAPGSSVAQGPVEYTDGGNTYVEVVFDQAIDNSSNHYNYTVYDRSGGEVGTYYASNNGNDSVIRLDLGGDTDLNGEATLSVQNNSEHVANHTITTTSATVSHDGDRTTAYAGARVAVTNSTNNSEYEVSGKSNSYVRSFRLGSNSQVAVLDTSDLDDASDYHVNFSDGTSQTLEIRDLGLGITADNVTTEDDVKATVTANRYGRNVDVTLLKNGDEVNTTNGDLDSDAKSEFNLGSVDSTGTYTIEATDVATGITNETQITVKEPATGTVTYDKEYYTVNRGDIAAFTLDIENSDHAEFEIGDRNEDFFQANATVTDDDEDGQVTVYFNTFATNKNDEDYLTVDEDSSIEYDADNDAENSLSEPLATSGGYEVRSYVGSNAEDAEELAVTELTVEKRSTDAISSWIAPEDVDTTNVSTLTDGLTDRDTVAKGDNVVLKVEATGIFGAMDGKSELENVDNMTLTIAESGSNVEANTKADVTTPVNFSMMKDADNGSFYAIVDTQELNDTEGKALGEFNATFDLNGDYALASDGNETVSTTFTTEAAEMSLNNGDEKAFPQGEGTITGETNLAPGTEINVRAASSGKFRKNSKVTVGSDGMFEAAFDLGNYDNGTTFEAYVSSPDGFESDSKISGAIDSSVQDEPDDTTTTTSDEPDDTTTTSDEPDDTTTTTSDEPDDTTTTTSDEPDDTSTTSTTSTTTNDGGQPGFGVGIAIVALMGAALLALRREN